MLDFSIAAGQCDSNIYSPSFGKNLSPKLLSFPLKHLPFSSHTESLLAVLSLFVFAIMIAQCRLDT